MLHSTRYVLPRSSLVNDGVTGRLVPLKGKGHQAAPDSEGLAEAIAPYCTDPALRMAHGRAGEERSREFSWEAINQVVADTYIRLIEERRALQAEEAAEAASS